MRIDKPVYECDYAFQCEDVDKVADRLYEKLSEKGEHWVQFSSSRLSHISKSTRFTYPRFNNGDFTIRFKAEGLRVFGTEDTVKSVLDSLQEMTREDNMITSLNPEPVYESVKFQPKGKDLCPVSLLKERVEDYLEHSEIYREKGEVSFKDIRNSLKDTIPYYYDPLLNGTDYMMKQSEKEWNERLDMVMYSMMKNEEFTLSVSRTTFASHDDRIVLEDTDSVKRDFMESGNLFDVKKVELSDDKEILYANYDGKMCPVRVRYEKNPKLLQDKEVDLYEYTVVFNNDNMEVQMPVITSPLPSEEFALVLENAGKEMEEKLAKLPISNSPLMHQECALMAAKSLEAIHEMERNDYMEQQARPYEKEYKNKKERARKRHPHKEENMKGMDVLFEM